MSIEIRGLINQRSKLFCIVVAIIICSFPLSYAVNNIALYLLVPIFFLDSKANIIRKLKALKTHKASLLFVAFFLVQCIGYFYSEDKEFALRRIVVMLPLCLIPPVMFLESITKKDALRLLCFLKYSIVITFIGLIIGHVFILKRTLNTFVHFTIEEQLGVSQFYIAFIVFLPILISFKSILEQKQLILHTILLCISVGVLFLLGNKTILFFLFASWIYFITSLFLKRKQKSAYFLMIIGCVCLFAAMKTPILKDRINVFIKTTDLNLETIITKNKYTQTKNTFEHRLLINYLALKEIGQSLPFGVGTGDFQNTLSKQYKKINFKAAIKGKLNNHNQYLSEFLKTGFLGGILFLWLLFSLFKKIKTKQSFYPFILTFFSSACVVESYLDRQHGVVIFAFLIPFFYVLDKSLFTLAYKTV